MRVAISTGGGDAPGLNAVIRAAVLSSLRRGWDVVGIQRGFGGFLEDDQLVELGRESVRGITHVGGTILGTTNRGNPFTWPVTRMATPWSEWSCTLPSQSSCWTMNVIGPDSNLSLPRCWVMVNPPTNLRATFVVLGLEPSEAHEI